MPLFDAYRQFYRRPSDPAGARAFLAERLAREDAVILLARTAGGRGVGFTQLYPFFSSVRMRPLWLLNDLYVAPSARRQGVARALMEAARLHAEAARVAGLTLATEKNNHGAKALYEALGYVLDEDFDYYERTL